MSTIINLTSEQMIANAMRKMHWSYDVAADTLAKATDKFEGEQLLVSLRNMGFFG